MGNSVGVYLINEKVLASREINLDGRTLSLIDWARECLLRGKGPSKNEEKDISRLKSEKEQIDEIIDYSPMHEIEEFLVYSLPVKVFMARENYEKYGIQQIYGFDRLGALSYDEDQLRPKLSSALAQRLGLTTFPIGFDSPLLVLNWPCFEFYYPHEIDELVTVVSKLIKEWKPKLSKIE
jgi:hypothetical protein